MATAAGGALPPALAACPSHGLRPRTTCRDPIPVRVGLAAGEYHLVPQRPASLNEIGRDHERCNFLTFRRTAAVDFAWLLQLDEEILELMCHRWPVALALLAAVCRSLRATGCVRRAAIEASLVLVLAGYHADGYHSVPHRIWCGRHARYHAKMVPRLFVQLPEITRVVEDTFACDMMPHRIRSPRARARPFEHTWRVLLHLARPTWSLGARHAVDWQVRVLVGVVVVRMWQEYFRIVAFDEYIAFGPTHTVWCAQGAKRLAERCGLVLAAHGGPLEWGAFALHCGRRRRHNDNNPHPVFEKSKLRTYPETGTFLCFVRNPGSRVFAIHTFEHFRFIVRLCLCRLPPELAFAFQRAHPGRSARGRITLPPGSD